MILNYSNINIKITSSKWSDPAFAFGLKPKFASWCWGCWFCNQIYDVIVNKSSLKYICSGRRQNWFTCYYFKISHRSSATQLLQLHRCLVFSVWRTYQKADVLWWIPVCVFLSCEADGGEWALMGDEKDTWKVKTLDEILLEKKRRRELEEKTDPKRQKNVKYLKDTVMQYQY